MSATEHIITITEIRESWEALINGDERPEHVQGHQAEYGRNPDRHYDWMGASPREISRALSHGFFPDLDTDIIKASAYGTQEILVPQVMTNEEEGELLIDQVLAGEDEYYAALDMQPANLGVEIIIQFGTNSASDAKTQGDYFEWCLHVIDTLERKGVSPSVTMRSTTADLMYDRDGDTIIDIPLVQEGERVDPITWRAFLNPGAFRSLGFLTFGMAAVREGDNTTSGLGRCKSGSQFLVDYDPEDGVIHIGAPTHMGGEFPADEMTRNLNTILERF